MSEALEVEIEEAWFRIIRCRKPVTVYLTCGHRVVWGSRAEQIEQLWEVGTYTKDISLEYFRDDVFDTFDKRARASRV